MPPPVKAAAPSNPMTASDIALLMRFVYDATGMQYVQLNFTTLVAWYFDAANPTTPGVVPIGIGNMNPAAPNTAPIISPQWAVMYPARGIIFTDNESWAGEFYDFLVWLASNNGASRIVVADPPVAELKNIWTQFSRDFPQYVNILVQTRVKACELP